MRTIILGIGNTILTDEGVGVCAAQLLDDQYRFPPGVEVIDGGTAGMEMLDDLAQADLLVVLDTIMAGKPPGSIVRLAGDKVPVYFRKKLSPHQIGLADVLASLELMDRLPKETVVLGVQPVSLELGTELTPTIAAKLPELTAMALAELAAHGIYPESK